MPPTRAPKETSAKSSKTKPNGVDVEAQKSQLQEGDPASNDDGQNLSRVTAATTYNNKPKHKKCNCLRPDVRHNWSIFVTTFYRIWIYRKTHVLLTLLQLLLPLLILILMTTYLGNTLTTRDKPWSMFKAVSEEQLYQKISTGEEGVITCHVARKNTIFAEKFIDELEEMFKAYNITLKMVNTKEDILKEYIRLNLKGESKKYIAGIEIFEKRDPKVSSRPGKNGIDKGFTLEFKIAMAKKTPGFYFRQKPLFFHLEKNLPKHYEALLGIELTICRTFHKLLKNQTQTLKSTSKKDETIKLEIQALPYPAHHVAFTHPSHEAMDEEIESEEVDLMLSTIFVLCMVPTFFTVVEGPVTEKEKGFKLYLLLMGYPRAAYWFSWILNQMIIQLIVIGLQVWLMFFPFNAHTGQLIRYGDAYLWFVVLALFNLSCMGFLTFLAAFFRHEKMATYIAILIWLLSFHIVQSHILAFDLASKYSSFMLSCLIPSACLHWTFFILTSVNANTWKASLEFNVTQNSGFRLPDVLVMMVVNFFIYFLLTLYVDNLCPGPTEMAQPWNYFFEGIRCRYIDPNKDISGGNRELSTREPAIEFQQVSKGFLSGANTKTGVDKVKFTAYAHQITVLLGHQDAGKSTLVRLVCGEYAPTSGTVSVFGYNVRRDTQKVQSYLSICLKDNALCSYLTVIEHMILIGRLKGLTLAKAKETAKNLLEQLELFSIRNDAMWKLVKWQRRMLCIAMAVVGNSRILILDEPTRELDIDAKRQIWSLLKELKAKGKTILMTTSSIDEAYSVADRIVIMSRGKVAGVGLPSKLEDIFETGYHLSLQLTEDADKDNILKFLEGIIVSIQELEGGFSQVKKAIQVTDWSESQALLPTVNLEQPRKSITNNFFNWFGDSGKKLSIVSNKSLSKQRLSAKDSLSTILKARTSKLIQEIAMHGMTMNCLVRFGEEPNFPKLFAELENKSVTEKLGIKDYELKLHDMDLAFNEVDDYVDVIDAAPDIELDDLSDIKVFRKIIDEADNEPIPPHSIEVHCSCCMSMSAIISKRLNHVVGNYKLALVQVIAPIIILLLTLYSTDIYFNHKLQTHPVAFNKPLQMLRPILPYKWSNSSKLSKKFKDSFIKHIGQSKRYFRKPNDVGKKKFENYYKDEYLKRLHSDLIVAADFSKLLDDNNTHSRVIALFSPGRYHSAPLSLLLMFNAILDYEFPNEKYRVRGSGYSIANKRDYVLLMNSTFTEVLKENNVDITLAVSIAFGYFIFTSGFVSQPNAERLKMLKRYQMNTLKWNGLYWMATSVLDITVNHFVVLFLGLTIYYFPTHTVFRNLEFMTLFSMTGIFGGYASILFSYFWSHLLLRSETSYYATLSINQVLGLFVFLLYSIINFEIAGSYARTVATFCLQVIQPFTLPWNFHVAILEALKRARCGVLLTVVKKEMCSQNANNYKDIKKIRQNCCSGPSKFWSIEFIWKNTNLIYNFTFLLCHCILGILILMYMESKRLKRNLLKSGIEDTPQLRNEEDIKSIEKESQQVEKFSKEPDNKNIFIVRNLSTSTNNRTILWPMSFYCKPGECTAIVGGEASGLTTLYNVLGGIRAVASGNVSYGGYSLFGSGSRKQFLYHLGLCPSHDVTIEKLTGIQLLKCFGRLRGIPRFELKNHVDYWTEALGLDKVIKDRCIHYSPVTRKKIGVAMAVIGNPPVVILDEPTSNLDPVSRCQICKILENLLKDKRIVIVLTHELPSIQHLCNKLLFLVNGQIQFCEDTKSLQKYIANQFTLIVILKTDERGKFDVKSYIQLKSAILEQMQGVTLQEEQSHTLIFRIQRDDSMWFPVFENIEKIVTVHSEIIAAYHVRRTSIKDLYENYAVNQRVFRRQLSPWNEFRSTYC